MDAKPGDRVKIVTKDVTNEGILLPSEEKDTLVLKLDSGYNVGIVKKNVKSITVVKKATERKEEKVVVPHNPKLPTVAILHTGGTIASKVDYSSGAVTAAYTAEDFIKIFPEVSRIANIDVQLIARLMSEDMRFKHYKLMADAVIEKQKKGIKGVIIGHGTDTLAYSAAALAFMLENIQIPVLFIGAQRSSDRPSTDAAVNVQAATQFIVKTDFRGVAVCMHENMNDDTCVILPACKTRKMHTTRRDAFRAVNDTPIARVTPTGEVTFLKKEFYQPEKGKTFAPKLKIEEKVGLLKMYPNLHPEIIDVFTKHGYKGLVLEGTGLGHAPTNIEETLPNYEALKTFIKKGGMVVMTSQCLYGRVHPFVYTNLRRLAEIGIIFGEDMLPETAYVKLAWLLGNYKPEEVKKLMAQNMRGEITLRTEREFDVP
ncbi:Glu-tRNA(Gln) amidotransferase subunit GatD [Candidatus Woesearchaeota archaeon]|nr:Glu-tRNA(Gln) amidotransferase subunit GatD [Candidatus Woesearchaeota archaeon]